MVPLSVATPFSLTVVTALRTKVGATLLTVTEVDFVSEPVSSSVNVALMV